MVSKLRIFLTGFGPFGDISENPTSILTKKVKSNPKAFEQIPGFDVKIVKIDTLDVCISAVEDYFSKVSEILEKDASLLSPDTLILFLHCGVYNGSLNFLLERQGCNNKDFRIPDVEGNQPKNEKIDDSFPLNHLLTDHQVFWPYEKIESLANALFKEASKDEKLSNPDNQDFLGTPLKPSCDAGKYLCNYIYFRSLIFSKNLRNKQNKKNPKESVCLSTFLHFPGQDDVSLTSQELFFKCLLESFCVSFLQEK